MIYIMGPNGYGVYFSSGATALEDCKGMIVVMKCGHIIDRKTKFPECDSCKGQK